MRTRSWIFTAVTFLIFLFYHSLLKIYYKDQSRGLSDQGRRASSKNVGENDGFAYVFYATADLYACATLVNIQRLKTLGSTIPIHVLASDYLSIPYMDALQDADVTVHIEETPRARLPYGSYYEDCLLKLLAFKMHKLDPSLKRVLIFDSDQLLLKHFDNLFSDLPRVDLAAPRAYWQTPKEAAGFSSAFMMITLSDRLWEKVNKTLSGDEWPAEGSLGADMDILNEELGDTATILSGEYVTLNSHWESWWLPSWFHPEDTPSYNRTISDIVPDSSELMDKPSAAPLADLKSRGTDQSTMAHLEHKPLFPEQSEIFQQLIQLQEYASIVHFSALGKPWTYSVQEAMQERPGAHPLFAYQFGMWRKVASEVCPEDWSVK
ncbi:hypothetical protein VMCG_03798 [Cytospora schulzeri]|uniref:Nucleotide-diphospho-sugar transferase domain-containing protein n=1 Tax=Cytospora schulzeri TaxID=448051 RepID=A0A423WUJ8_9PEZI|nr:hypothetical protein VMCG_03798 [Valsa malicola]